MKIYTKKGDQGMTSLFGGNPLPKDHTRIEAYGTVDELNSVIGCVLAELSNPLLHPSRDALEQIQKELFIVGSELASLDPPESMKKGFIQAVHISALESQIDQMENELAPLRKFILPGGSKSSSLLHLARTICRRAERAAVALSHQEEIRPEILIYLNRLSDFLFVKARFVNLKSNVEDQLWEGILKS